MTRIYSAQPRFLSFTEASIVDRVLSEFLQALEQQGSTQEGMYVQQILRTLVYFTSKDTLEDLRSYLLTTGWQPGGQRNEGRLHISVLCFDCGFKDSYRSSAKRPMDSSCLAKLAGKEDKKNWSCKRSC